MKKRALALALTGALFTACSGPTAAPATGGAAEAKNTLRAAADFRLPPMFADVSNLDGNNKPFGRDDRKRLLRLRADAM